MEETALPMSSTHDGNRVSPRVAVSCALLLALFLSFNNLDARSVWLDEAVSIRIASLDWSDFWGFLVRKEANMGLYYFLLKFWVILGKNELAVRSLSAVCSAGTVPIIYLIGKRLFDVRVGVTAAWLIAANAFFIRYAQETRAYGLLILLVSVSSYLFLECLENSTKIKWAMYLIISVLAVYTHFFALLVPLCHAASIPFLNRKDVKWRSVVVCIGLFGLSVAPLLLFILTRDSGQVDWIAPLNLLSLPGLFFAFSGLVDLLAVALYLIFFPLGLAGLSVRCRGAADSRERWHYAFLLLWLTLPIILVVLISLVKPLFVSRYFIICLPPFILISALGLARIKERWSYLAWSSVAVIISINSVYTSYHVVKGADWRSATRFVLASSRPDDVVITYRDYQTIPFDYYCEKLSGQRRPLEIAHPSLTRLNESMLTGSALQSDPLVRSFKERKVRVWLLICNDFPDGQYGNVSLFGRFVKKFPLSGEKHRNDKVGVLVRSLDSIYRCHSEWQFEKIRLVLLYD